MRVTYCHSDQVSEVSGQGWGDNVYWQSEWPRVRSCLWVFLLILDPFVLCFSITYKVNSSCKQCFIEGQAEPMTILLFMLQNQNQNTLLSPRGNYLMLTSSSTLSPFCTCFLQSAPLQPACLNYLDTAGIDVSSPSSRLFVLTC